jgi:hypothetical protein
VATQAGREGLMLGGLTDEHLDEVRAGDGEEGHARLPRHRLPCHVRAAARTQAHIASGEAPAETQGVGVAGALARRVLPVPGGPTRRAPLGILAPRLVKSSGSWGPGSARHHKG